MSPRLAILGPGLLGGSLALAARARALGHVTLWARRAEAIDEINAAGCADVATGDVVEAVRDATHVILCTPVGAMGHLARQIAPSLQADALVMDVGSVKAPVVNELTPIFAGRGQFIGCHPMAGSEQTGLAAARADLFDGAACIVTPEPSTPAAATEAAVRFWEGVGCVVTTASPELHDLHVAWVSHLPHLLAAALVQAVSEGDAPAFELCGPGFRDSTRIASGAPGMWTEIIAENRAAIGKALDGLIEKLRGLSTLLAHAPAEERDSSMYQLLNQAKAQRDRLRLPKFPTDA